MGNERKCFYCPVALVVSLEEDNTVLISSDDGEVFIPEQQLGEVIAAMQAARAEILCGGDLASLRDKYGW